LNVGGWGVARRAVAVAACAVSILAIGWAALDLPGTVRMLDEGWRRYHGLGATERRDHTLSWAEEDAASFKQFDVRLDAGDRFALVLGPGTRTRSELYELLSRYYFYPAVNVGSLGSADHVVAFGGAPPVRGFRLVVEVGDDWIASREP
jgi:hypothetical protein